ncbi:MAG: hypothetical protein ACK4IY_10130, partial [Chitinophagales bacterium]
ISHGNWYEMEIETNIQDASIGYVMLGNGDGTFKPVHARNSGFISQGNAKALSMITLGSKNTPVIITTNNAGKSEVFTFNGGNKVIKLNPDDVYAEITLSNGKKRRTELYTGAGYLSQNTKSIVVTDEMKGITVFNLKGESRNVLNNNLLTAK